MALQRDKIIETAFRLLDEEGLDGMTLRKLACAVGVRAPSLYWHFRDKRDLLDAMSEALLEGVARDIPTGAHWRETVHRIGAELRQAFKSRRDGARVYAGTFAVSRNVLRTTEALVQAFRDAGAEPEFAATAGLHVMHYVLGFVIEEQALPTDPDQVALLKQAFTDAVEDGCPCLRDARDALLEPDFDARFREGLELLLDGVERRVAAGRGRKR
ncbi:MULTISPECIES: TetR/AcrR family transcriptional regulator C-terminal domain-containing protein [Pseudoxanthomonas]|mgnify:CR=1 FL=1|jgi:TetR/AcrR family tetracycline transcriptional repressor|uniref:TetR family transcriptional regulator n=1 Tax=Pseudoxanthomonas taiwanensis J19 TaxID=935569 RepID=A0A562DII9_9GAMM|nr:MULTISPECIES: TetR/AcrR family transcriptional regulator C-terminal domain-containing protein [Pseudoxanthomonas]TWH09383.1 TetR family transcriptional regulator [Pseudoxanthomonas taiwanensis J19]